jgi:hypothetical protein
MVSTKKYDQYQSFQQKTKPPTVISNLLVKAASKMPDSLMALCCIAQPGFMHQHYVISFATVDRGKLLHH